jgi:hypothetical protein
MENSFCGGLNRVKLFWSPFSGLKNVFGISAEGGGPGWKIMGQDQVFGIRNGIPLRDFE